MKDLSQSLHCMGHSATNHSRTHQYSPEYNINTDVNACQHVYNLKLSFIIQLHIQMSNEQLYSFLDLATVN